LPFQVVPNQSTVDTSVSVLFIMFVKKIANIDVDFGSRLCNVFLKPVNLCAKQADGTRCIVANQLHALCRCYDLDGAIAKIEDLGGAEQILEASSGCGLDIEEETSE
jgi:hypothetical protein